MGTTNRIIHKILTEGYNEDVPTGSLWPQPGTLLSPPPRRRRNAKKKATAEEEVLDVEKRLNATLTERVPKNPKSNRNELDTTMITGNVGRSQEFCGDENPYSREPLAVSTQKDDRRNVYVDPDIVPLKKKPKPIRMSGF